MNSEHRSIAGVSLVLVLLAASCSSTSQRGSVTATPADDLFASGAHRRPTVETYHSMSNVLAAQGREAEGEAVLLRLVTDYPTYAPGYNDLAELYMRTGRSEQAVAALEQGIAAAPDDAVLWNNLGMCHLVARDFERAVEAFQQATERRTGDRRARANLALALGLVGRDEESQALYAQLVDEDGARHNLRILRSARLDASATPATAAGAAGPKGAGATTEAARRTSNEQRTGGSSGRSSSRRR